MWDEFYPSITQNAKQEITGLEIVAVTLKISQTQAKSNRESMLEFSCNVSFFILKSEYEFTHHHVKGICKMNLYLLITQNAKIRNHRVGNFGWNPLKYQKHRAISNRSFAKLDPFDYTQSYVRKATYYAIYFNERHLYLIYMYT